jgi:enoyl-CoA hydratase/carnithine racemase
MAISSSIILQESNNGISRIKLNDQSSYNALSLNTLQLLIKGFKRLGDDKKTKVIIIEGLGKGFCAGHDLKEITSLKGKTNYSRLFNLCSQLMLTIINNNKPVIAKVHGAAYAAGCQLVATCDLALSTNDSVFATPGVNIGLFCSTPMEKIL